jgi:NTE family protein
MQDRITRSRMAGDPPDVVLTPRLAHIRLLEFDRAEEAIDEGRAAVRRATAALQEILDATERGASQ